MPRGKGHKNDACIFEHKNPPIYTRPFVSINPQPRCLSGGEKYCEAHGAGPHFLRRARPRDRAARTRDLPFLRSAWHAPRAQGLGFDPSASVVVLSCPSPF